MTATPRFLFGLVALGLGWGAVSAADDWESLFNGRDLTGWDSYLGAPYDVALKRYEGDPIGLNQDPHNVFTVVKVNGQPSLRISGQDFGGIASVREFENYHLRLQFKWGTLKHPPRTEVVRDSGVLYHSVGGPASGSRFWMTSQEFQVQEGDCGDYWRVGADIALSIRAREETGPDGKLQYHYDPVGKLVTFDLDNPGPRSCKKSPDAEKPSGEWNTLDLYCYGTSAMHVMNGVVVMILHDSKLTDGQGGYVPHSKGKLQIQSEGAEIFYREIKIRLIDRLPDLQVAGSLP
jgi:hypothetical protein